MLSTFERRGHHAAFIGEILFNRYVLVAKTGLYREHSTWVAKDMNLLIFVRIKIFRGGKKSVTKGLQKIRLLQFLQKSRRSSLWTEEMRFFVKNSRMGQQPNFDYKTNFCINLLNCFFHKGILDQHLCLVEEFAHDSLLNQLHSDEIDFSEAEVLDLLMQVALGLYFLHQHCGVIHGNLNPERILLRLPDEYVKKYMLLLLFQTRLDAETRKRKFLEKRQSRRNRRLIFPRIFKKKETPPKKGISFFATGFNLETPKKRRKLLQESFLSEAEFEPKVNTNLFDDCSIALNSRKGISSKKHAFRKEQKDIFELRIKKQFFEDFVSEKGLVH